MAKRRFLSRSIVATALMVFLCLDGVAFAEMNISQIANKYSPSVVTIVALDKNDQPLGLGSGFFINKSGAIATNHHVLEGCAKAIIKTTKGQKGQITEVIKDDPRLDLLVAKTTLTSMSPLPLGDSDAVTVGEDIVVIGNPAGLEGTVSKGIISGIRTAKGIRYIQITAPISPGSSGGPVFNLSGKVVGVASAYVSGGQNLNFAMPSNYLNGLKLKSIRLEALSKTEDPALDSMDMKAVKVIHVYLDRINGTLSRIDFSIQNNSNYAIRDVKLFFIYKNESGQIIDCSSQLFVKNIQGRTDSINLIPEPIFPKLAQQFSHLHQVNHFGRGTVEIRILDYKIDRSWGTSPVDSILK